MNGTYQIYKRNMETGIREKLIERYTELSVILNWGDMSKFTIKGKTSGDLELDAGDGIAIYRDGEFLLGGIIETLDVNCENVYANLKEWTASGKEDSIVFSQYLVFPNPTNVTFDNEAVDKVTDYADNRQIYYIRRNMGADAMQNRRISGLVIEAGLNRGQSAESAYRYKTVEEVIKEIGKETDDDDVANNIYPKFIWNPLTGVKSVEIQEQRDMTESVILSPDFGNITGWSKSHKLPKCNAVWVVSGEYQDQNDANKNLRNYTYMEDAESIEKYGRIEKVVTKGDIKVVYADPQKPDIVPVSASEVVDLLTKEGKAYLEENAYKEKFTATMVETPELQFMLHWKCGDLVTCMIDGQKFASTIKTVSVDYSNGFEKVKPTIGENDKGQFAELFEQINGLEIRMNTEELS